MAKGKKTPARRPVKARGSLPAPRVAPTRRPRVVWYRRRRIQIAGGVFLVGLVALGVWLFLDARAEAREARRAVERFDRAVSAMVASASDALGEMSSAPEEFRTGSLPADEFLKRTEAWLTALRQVDSRLRARAVPGSLTESRALLVQGIVLFIDAAKSFQAAAKLTDAPLRDDAIGQGRNVALHAAAVFAMGRRELLKAKQEIGLPISEAERPLLQQEIQLPTEEAPPPPPPGELPPGGLPPGLPPGGFPPGGGAP